MVNSIYDNCSPSWRDETRFFELGGFSTAETTAYLTKRDIDHPGLIEAIHNFTSGVPLAVALAVNAVEHIGNQEAAIPIFSSEDLQARHSIERRRIIEEVAERFLSLVEPEERDIIHACAVLGRFDQESLDGILGKKLSSEQIERIEHYSFIRRPDEDYLFHDTVRTFVLRELQSSSPEDRQQLHEAAATFFEKKRALLDIDDEAYESEEWRGLTLEIVYHKLQAGETEGVNKFYCALADALWNREFTFSLELLDLLSWPLSVYLESSNPLSVSCQALTKRNYQEARDNLEKIISIDEDNCYLRQLAHDTLGDLYSPNTTTRL